MLRVLIAAAVGLTLLGVTAQKPARRARDLAPVPVLLRPTFAKTLSKAHLPLLIDLYYLRVLNAIGHEDSEEKNKSLHGYGVFLTELDPRFYQAYLYTGLNVPYLVDKGQYLHGALAADILRRGLRAFPDDLRLHVVLGFTLFAMVRDYAGAGDVFAQAARLPDAPPYFGPLAARLYAQAGKPDDGIQLMKDLLQDDSSPELRANVEKRVFELETEKALQQVDAALRAYEQRHQRPAASVDELVRDGYAGPTTDPAGEPITLGPDGRALSPTLKRRLELYE